MKIYLLWHVYELTDDFGTRDEEKLLGTFSSAEKANDAIDFYKNLDGFRDHPLTCFKIDEYETDKPSNWIEGFFTTRWTE